MYSMHVCILNVCIRMLCINLFHDYNTIARLFDRSSQYHTKSCYCADAIVKYTIKETMVIMLNAN